MADDSPDKLSQNVGLKEIAQRSGVGVITVSRAINHPETVAEKTRRRIYQAIDELGFIPNQVAGNLARSQARIIGTVVPPLINSGIAEQVQGMSDVLREKGFQLLISQGEFTLEIEESLIRSLLGWRPAGFILQAYVQSEKARSYILSRDVPTVEISEIEGSTPIGASVGVSNFARRASDDTASRQPRLPPDRLHLNTGARQRPPQPPPARLSPRDGGDRRRAGRGPAADDLARRRARPDHADGGRSAN